MLLHRLALALLAILPSTAVAADQPATDLDQVMVTANRIARTVDETLAPVDVIGRDEIVRSQAQSLPDLLRGRAGISLANQGGAGKLTTLFLRGSESDHVVVLVDGVRIGSPTSGLASLQDLPMAMIDRVEIVRGARSSLYGSEAIGGVIQVFTRRDGEGLHPRASATLGSHGSSEGRVGLGGARGRLRFGVDATYAQREGFDACEVATPAWYDGGCFILAPEPDNDGYRNRSLSLRGGFDASEALKFDAHALRAEGRNAYDGDFFNLSKVVQQVVGGSATWTPSPRMQWKLAAGRNVDASDNYFHGFDGFANAVVEVDRGYFDTDRDSATLQGDFTFTPTQQLTVGLDWLRDRVDSDTPYDVSRRGNRAVFGQYRTKLGAHALEASLRRDDNDQFGGHTTGAAAWGTDLGQRMRVRAGFARAFKAPTFNELYYPGFSNPDLRPETSRSWDAGVSLRGDGFNLKLDAFDTRVDDLIAYDALAFRPDNIERARLRGAELSADTTLAGWTTDAALSVVDSESLAGDYVGRELPRRARHSARVDADRAFGTLRVGLTAVSEGARYNDVANSQRLGGFATFDLRAEIALTADWTLQGRVANVFDRQYQTVKFYRQAGREWFVTLRWAPAD